MLCVYLTIYYCFSYDIVLDNNDSNEVPLAFCSPYNTVLLAANKYISGFVQPF